MNTSTLPSTGMKWETITRKWWFFLIVLFFFFLPGYSSLPYDPQRTPEFITAVLSNAVVLSVPAIYPIFKVIPIVLVIGIILWGDRVTRIFTIYAAINLLVLAVLQNMALTAQYGFSMITGNIVVYVIVAGFWIWEAIVKRNDFSPRPTPLWRYWVVPLAFFAFWFPAGTDTTGISIDFNPALIVTNSAGLAVCMITPVYLAVLTIYYPTINLTMLRVTSFATTITGLINLIQWFGFQPEAWWMGVLHIPMVVISIYAFGLSLRKPVAARRL